ncbi:MAG TPA: FAD-dependent oxidoreductase [Nitrososphaerales archaeon]|nr:FAD-dependent oxidoreductase [Nitrososphaerales archaeon]
MAFNNFRIVHSDVLVIGSGVGGMRAAIEAKSLGASVLVVDKALIGLNNASRFSGGGIKAALPDVLTTYYTGQFPDPKIAFKRTLIHGEYLNDQELARALCFDAPERIMELEEKFGVEHVGEIYHYTPYPHGHGLMKPLIDTAKKGGVMTKEGTMIIELVKKNGAVVGALGIDIFEDDLILFVAKSTILAAGEAGELYLRNDTTANTTGDGYTLAYEAGAPMRDMEFVMFEPFVMAEKGLPMMDRHESEAEFYGILRNNKGEAFLDRYLKRIGLESDPFHKRYGKHLTDTRELVSRAMAMEVHEGRGDQDAVLFDLTVVPEDKWTADIASVYTRRALLRGFDVKKKMLHVFPGCISFLGGVSINSNCETELPGLYACGMVTGGVHGASRLGGHGLADGIVFGPRAGRAAAERAKRIPMPQVDWSDVEQKKREIDSLLAPKSDPIEPQEAKMKLKKMMWDNAGILRSEESLNRAMTELERMKKETLPRLAASDPRSLRYAFEVIFMTTLAEMVVRAAQMRKESRGPHYRLDRRYRDDAGWLKNIFITKGNDGSMRLELKPVTLTYEKPDYVVDDDFGLEVRRMAS